MNGNPMRVVVAAAVALLILVGGGIYLADRSSSGVGAPPAATPSPSPTPTSPPSISPSTSPTPEPTPVDTTGWVPFSSDRFGYDMALPPTWTATQAARDWSLEVDKTNDQTVGADLFVEEGVAYQIAVQAFSAPVPAGMSNEDWIAASTAPYGGCTPLPIDQWEAITVDGQPAMFNRDACDASQAFVFIGDRVYRFSVWRGDQEPLLKAFLTTVRFHPESLPSTSPATSP